MKHSIGVKIFIIAILLAFVAQVSNGLNYMGMKKISNLSLKITDEYLQSKNNLETVSNQLSELQKQILFHYIESDDSKRKDIENKITATKGTLVSAIDSLKKGADSDRETEELEELEKQYSDYVEIYDKAVSLNNENEAMELINGEIKERGEKVSTYLESVNIINKANIIRAKKEQAQAEKMYVVTLTISDKAKDGSQYAEDIKKRANDLKDEAVASRSSTYDMAEKISEVVKNALVNCKSVNEIESLTSEILEISEQTNLLALNASIEAARAGEAGKSFSVVAEEIRELADNSKNTANDIQEISKKVIDAVGNVAGNSTELVSSMDIIQEEMNKNDDISNRLMNEVDKCKNV